MLLFPNAKINLGLRVVEKRSDGFHNIETVFYPVNLCDILEFIAKKSGTANIEVTGLETGGNVADNLVIKAWQLMHDLYGIPSVRIHLHKVIPIGAGLGGGSSDAAFMLKGLNKEFSCGCNIAELKELALKIGSDCPFFIDNVPSFAAGRGELLKPLSVTLKDYGILLKKPDIHINTGWAYSKIKPDSGRISLEELIVKPIEQWQEFISNDFEKVVFQSFPVISALKKRFIEMGADFSSMSGSGSAVFGLFRREVLQKISPGKYSDCLCINPQQN